MRIAMFTETFLPSTDGIVTRLCATLRHLEEEGHEVLLFAPKGAPKTFASATIVGVPAFRFFLYPEKAFALPWLFVSKEIRAFKPDLIHAVNPAFVGLGAIYAAWRHNLPLLASYHTNVTTYAQHYHLNWLEPALWWYFRNLHNRAQVNLCTSRATGAQLEEHGFRNVALWDRGVDIELYTSAQRTDETRKRLAPDVKEGDNILLYVGRLATEKNIERLRPCLEQSPNTILVLVGDGPHRSQLERVFSGTRTYFTGYLFGRELADAYVSCDGFVFPSTTETLGLVLFEAMASGLPVMAASSPPTREVLEGGRAGYIFDPGSTESLLETMHRMFTHDERRDLILERAKEIAMSLDWRGPTKQLVGYYRQTFSNAVAVSSSALRGSR